MIGNDAGKGYEMLYEPSEQKKKQLENNFTYHKPKEDQTPKYEEIRAHARAYASELVVMCPESRELSLALTKLEEVVFWANAAIARNE